MSIRHVANWQSKASLPPLLLLRRSAAQRFGLLLAHAATKDARPHSRKHCLSVGEIVKVASQSAIAVLATLCVALNPVLAVNDVVLDPQNPVLDLARVVPDGQEEQLRGDLASLEQRTGWRLRLLTRNGPKQGPTGEEIRHAWAYDRRTAVVLCDPTSPNILQFQAGDEVTAVLRRGFFIELQSRYGNKFYVRDEGEGAAVLSTLKAMSTCLERGGCAVVPGLPEDQYQLTLITSLIGGCVFGFSTTIKPQGFVQRRFVWPLLFSPLWGTLFISFGIGPIVTRTEACQGKTAITCILRNGVTEHIVATGEIRAFLAAAALFRASPLFKSEAVDLSIISKEGQKKQDEKDMSEE